MPTADGVPVAKNTPETLAEVFRRFDSSERGLSSGEALRRLAEVGPNETAPAKVGGPLREFIRFCRNPLC